MLYFPVIESPVLINDFYVLPNTAQILAIFYSPNTPERTFLFALHAQDPEKPVPVELHVDKCLPTIDWSPATGDENDIPVFVL